MNLDKEGAGHGPSELGAARSRGGVIPLQPQEHRGRDPPLPRGARQPPGPHPRPSHRSTLQPPGRAQGRLGPHLRSGRSARSRRRDQLPPPPAGSQRPAARKGKDSGALFLDPDRRPLDRGALLHRAVPRRGRGRRGSTGSGSSTSGSSTGCWSGPVRGRFRGRRDSKLQPRFAAWVVDRPPAHAFELLREAPEFTSGRPKVKEARALAGWFSMRARVLLPYSLNFVGQRRIEGPRAGGARDVDDRGPERASLASASKSGARLPGSCSRSRCSPPSPWSAQAHWLRWLGPRSAPTMGVRTRRGQAGWATYAAGFTRGRVDLHPPSSSGGNAQVQRVTTVSG